MFGQKSGLNMQIVVQVQHLELLAKLYVRRGRHDLASQVWEVVAVCKGGLGDKAITLQDREEAFQNAVREVRPAAHNMLAHDRLC